MTSNQSRWLSWLGVGDIKGECVISVKAELVFLVADLQRGGRGGRGRFV